MNIGFDAKRAFTNSSGLGNYSRTLIKSLVNYFPVNNYFLYTPQKNKSSFAEFINGRKNCTVVQPKNIIDKKINSRWRSYGITNLLNSTKINVYHGLSNELPFNISKFHGRKIVTIHDLIFLRHPQLYPLIDRKIYNRKVKSACESADKIIAVSVQTKNDILEFYKINPEKIKVIYQSCDGIFYKPSSSEEIKKVKSKYHLPETYLLNIGTIEERKNLLTIVKALNVVKDISLVVVGKKKSYFKKVQEYIAENKLQKRILFPENISDEDLPAIYSGAAVFIYPSLLEGFGIPIIEALTRGIPVITSQGGCFAEAGGADSIYIEPLNHGQLAEEIKKLLSSSDSRKRMSERGIIYARKFLPEKIAGEIMKLYSENA
ncbi:MAG: glycosyltransferase family 4 protein [Bacteroidetes bacterium]|nr:glycosyltransferase family 4 protein [Bacteroidota bacterium]